jgi:hypothetical protein
MQELSSIWIAFRNLFGDNDFYLIVFGTFIIHEVTWLLFNLPYLFIDDYKLFQRYKIQAVRTIENRYWSIDKDKSIESKIRWGCFWDLVRGHIFQLLPLTALFYPGFKFFGFSTAIELPTWWVSQYNDLQQINVLTLIGKLSGYNFWSSM